MAKKKKKKGKGRFQKGRKRHKMSLANRKAASRRMKALWRSGKLGKKRRKKGKKASGRHGQPKRKKRRRRGGNISFCLRCRRPIAGGAKGMLTHSIRKHGGVAPPPGVSYTPQQLANLARLREKAARMKAEASRAQEYESLFAQADAERAERERIAQAMQASMGAGRYAVG